MEQQKLNNITKDSFEFVGAQVQEEAIKTKPQGFYADVFKRFIKKKSSIIALSLIVLLLAFSLIMPATYAFDTKLSEPYFAGVRPRNFMSDGFYSRTASVNEYYSLVGVGVAAQFDDEDPTKVLTIDEGMSNAYQPIKSSRDVQLQFLEYDREGRNIKIDSYLETGFIYVPISFDEWDSIKAFESQSGRQVIYPMVDRYSAFVDIETGEEIFRPSAYQQNANYWYEIQDITGTPKWSVDGSGNETKGTFVPNYLTYTQDSIDARPELHTDLLGELPQEGDTAWYEVAANGKSLTVRVLSYNHFVYRHDGKLPAFWFGTNNAGQDIFSRLASGLRTSLLLALLVSLISLVIGIIVGSITGYFGGRTDLIIGRIQDVLIGIPTIVVLTLIYLNWIQPGKIPMFGGLLLGFCIFSWVTYAKSIRTQFFRFKGNEYVLASKTLGARAPRLMFKHVFPNALGTLITIFALAIPSVVLSEVVLYFLGILQLGEGGSSLGVLINEGSAALTTAPFIIAFPVVVFGIIMFSFNLLGNALRDSFDPSQRGK